jgi:hypothetical protein
MVRWVAFDDESAEAVVSRYKRGAAEIQPGDAVGSALELGRPSLVLLPARNAGRVVMARFQPTMVEEMASTEVVESPAVVVEEIVLPQDLVPTTEATAVTEEFEPIGYETSGFLGLSDQPIYYAPDPPAKRKWWQKLTN